MQVKKFIGESVPDCMAKIRKEFGDDAIILSTEKVEKGGILGMFKKEEIHILAALDRDILRNKRSVDATPLFKTKSKVQSDLNLSGTKEKVNKYKNVYSSAKSDVENQITKHEEKENISSKESELMKKDIDEIKNTVINLSKKINETFRTEEEKKEYKEKVKWVNKLMSVGISERFSMEIMDSLEKKHLTYSKENIIDHMLDIFKDYIFEDIEKDYKNIVFIGSTGVGKTTTLAKLSSKKVINDRKRVGFLTLDTYRIAAVDQLKTYAEILSSPIEIAYEIKDLEFSLKKLSTRDYVYIDTAGRSHKNKRQVEDLKQILDKIDNKKIYLVLSANIGTFDALDIIKTYSFLSNYDIIVTKVDETNKRGKVLDIIKDTGKLVKYIAFGQNVPDDIEKFDLKKYIFELFGEIDND